VPCRLCAGSAGSCRHSIRTRPSGALTRVAARACAIACGDAPNCFSGVAEQGPQMQSMDDGCWCCRGGGKHLLQVEMAERFLAERSLAGHRQHMGLVSLESASEDPHNA
jgi:hypothetical protein